MSQLLDEIREITAQEVAKKQDAAKVNYPAIIERIKTAAKSGNSEVSLTQSLINEFDKKLLVADGFTVQLMDRPRESDYYTQLGKFNPNTKIWVIKW